MARPSRATNIDSKIELLKEIRQGVVSPDAEKTIAESLKDSNWLVVSEACEAVTQLGLRSLEQAVRAVWPRFVENAAKRDPGCRAKLAALKALDYMELIDEEPFLIAIRYRQFEPALGCRVDTAGLTRVRALLALLRMVHSQASHYAGELMADPDAQVRAGAAQAIGHYANPSSIALLTYKLRASDDDPAVLLESALALMSTDPQFGLGILVPMLSGTDDVNRETAAMALGQCRNPEATQALLDWSSDGATDGDHYLAIRALGLSRDEQARLHLLEIVESGPNARARAAVEALAIHRYDTQLVQLVQAAVGRRHDMGIQDFVKRVFGE